MAVRYQQLFADADRQRALAEALGARAISSRAPQQQGRITPSMSWGEGLAQIGEALIARRSNKKASEMSAQADEERRRAQVQALSGLIQPPNAVETMATQNPYARAQTALNAEVDPALVQSYMQQQQPNGRDLIGVANPSDFTPQSLAKYQQSGNPGDLEPVEKNLFGRYNPRDYTPESLAAFEQSGNPGDLKRVAPYQFQQTPGGGLVSLDPISGRQANTVRTPQAGTAEAATRAGAEAQASATGRIAGEAEGAILSKATNAEGVLSLLELAEPLIEVATGSTVGAARDAVAGFFGRSMEGAEAIGQLKVLQAGLILGMPRLEGPQSDKDRALYIEAAGQIGDPNVPKDIKKAAVATIKAIQQKYIARAAPKELPEIVPPQQLQNEVQQRVRSYYE